MKRRQKGTGTIVKIKDIYYGRIMVKGKVKVVRLTANKRESEELWKTWLLENIQTLKTDTVRHNLNELWPVVKNNLIGQGLPDARIKRHQMMFRNLVRLFGEIFNVGDVESIDKGMILTVMETVSKEKSNGLKRDYWSAMKQLFKAAGMEDPEVLRGIKFRRMPSRAREPFTDEELSKIIEAAGKKGPEWKALVEIGLYTGLRLKDCVHLKVEDVKENVIELYPAKTKHHGTIVRIPVHANLKKTLDSLGVKSGYYLPDIVKSYGKATLINRLAKVFNVVGETSVEVAGRKRKVSVKGFHALRATFLTRLAESGVSLPIMESLAGHLNPAQTMHYTHPDEQVKKVAISTLPDFETGKESGIEFIPPEMQSVINQCKRTLEEVVAKALGKTVEVNVQPAWRISGETVWMGMKQLSEEIQNLHIAKRDLLSSERPHKDEEVATMNGEIVRLKGELDKALTDGL